MSDPRTEPFTFGVQLYSAADSWSWREQAREAADHGYASVHLPDHLGGQFSPVPALAAIAEAVPGLRIGTLVLNCATRHPVPLTKELATLDVLSDGRLEVGIGAGWQLTDFRRSGAERLAPAARIDRLVEHVDVMTRLWAGEEVTHAGRYYRFSDARCLPRPVQADLPLLIGGGSRRVLAFAGTAARAVGLDVPQPDGVFDPRAFLLAASRKMFLERASWATDAAREVGHEVTLVQQIPSDLVHLNGDSPDVVARRWKVGPGELLDSPIALVGATQAVIERLQEWRALSGVSRFVVPADAMRAARPIVDRLAGR